MIRVSIALLAISSSALAVNCGEGVGVCEGGLCCSAFGYCGATDDHCSVANGCQAGFGSCGAANPVCGNGVCDTQAGESCATCSEDCCPECGGGVLCPVGECCSEFGYCGTTTEFCGTGCQSGSCFTSASNTPSPVVSASSSPTPLPSAFASPSPGPSQDIPLDPTGMCSVGGAPCAAGECCSQFGFCGATTAYCGEGCQFGACLTVNPSASPVPSTTTIGECGAGAGGALCPTGECCSEFGFCGIGDEYCGSGCQSGDCAANPSVPPSPVECGSDANGALCPTGECCSQFGFCGTSVEFCGAGCQSGSCLNVVGSCGNGICEDTHLASGETTTNCPVDCGPPQSTSIVTSCLMPGEVSLTFDDGPFPFTNQLLDYLENNNIEASFFVVGQNVRTFPQDLVREFNSGFHIASHTDTHPNLNTLTLAEVHAEFVAADTTIRNTVCVKPRLYRQPFGAASATVRTLLSDMGYRSILWNVDSLDWLNSVNNPNTVLQDVANGISSNTPQGIIHLQHDLLAESIALVPQIVDLYLNAGYTPVSLPRCVWGPNFATHPVYIFEREACPSRRRELQIDTTSCPVSEWSDWSKCSAKCGHGDETRVRYTVPDMGMERENPACAGVEFIQMQPCFRHVCTAEGVVHSEWSEWMPCSKSCGGGTRASVRELLSGDPNPFKSGPLRRAELCNTGPCMTTQESRRRLRGQPVE